MSQLITATSSYLTTAPDGNPRRPHTSTGADTTHTDKALRKRTAYSCTSEEPHCQNSLTRSLALRVVVRKGIGTMTCRSIFLCACACSLAFRPDHLAAAFAPRRRMTRRASIADASTEMHALALSLPTMPTMLISNEVLEYEQNNAFNDSVTLTDLMYDPILQVAVGGTIVLIGGLFLAKAIVTEMDEAVVKVAKDFDRVMKLKYTSKWKFAEDDLSMTSEDRTRAVVEEMTRIEREEPEFYQRVMSDIEQM
ncbi:hypothetical protein THAOC_32846 [Thalassiosira oceanica]|uniref:Uncharacterized protein n=1 Tax=Thalassiosira oceanica TaxID=159749 RepID=K0RHE6_THAOC|nr:hypothetical protein THAOC_32846 [Thalassiosira oceanica]|eukprot:EJK48366.1 hypothetical protein THAOC_32846 [Thalassiosira oceanica]